MPVLTVLTGGEAWSQSPLSRTAQQTVPDVLRGQFDPDADTGIITGSSEPDARENARERRREDALGGLNRNGLEQSRVNDRTGGRRPESQSRVIESDTEQGDPLTQTSPGDGQPRVDDPFAPQTLREQDIEGEREQENDPYEALGIRIGSFLLFPELHVERIYTDNAFRTVNNPRSDQATEFTSSLELRSNWSRHLLEGSVSGLRSYYSDFGVLDDKEFAVQTHGRLDVARRTQIDVRAAHDRALESVDSNDAPTGAAERTNYSVNSGSLQVSHRFNRLTASLRGGLSTQDYEDVRLIGGGTANNDDRDFTEKSLTGRMGYEFRPGLQGFVEASGNEREFASTFDDNGIRNGSSGFEVQAGVSLEYSSKLQGEIAAGFARQAPDETTLEDISGLIISGNLEWRPTALTTFRFEANSDVQETTFINSAGSIARDLEFSVEHAFRRNLIAGVSLGYTHEEFSGTGQVDETYTFGLKGEYLLTRELALTADYQHSYDTSTVPASDYTENEFRAGVRLRR